jgi:hypothetical protein
MFQQQTARNQITWLVFFSHCLEVLKSHTLVLAQQVLGLVSDSEYGYHSYNRSQQDALILNCILMYNFTCFGQTYCPSSRVLILYLQ